MRTISPPLPWKNGQNLDNGGQSAERSMKSEFSFYKAPIANTEPSDNLSIQEFYRLIKGPDYKDITEKLRAQNDPEEYSSLKSKRLDYVTPSGIFSKRSKSALEEYSGYLVIDFDDLEVVERVKTKLRNDPYTLLLFTSPGGNGLKWIVRSNKGLDQHEAVFREISRYLEYKYDLRIDQSGKDVSRACFLCHDPDAYLNPDLSEVKPFTVAENKAIRMIDQASKYRRVNTEEISPGNLERVEHMISQLEDLDVDITSTYDEWINVAFSLGTLGEEGRSYFHRVSQLHPDYNKEECDKKFENILRTQDPDGIGIEYLLNAIDRVLPEKAEVEPPNFPIDIYSDLPPLLQKILEPFDDQFEKDMLLNGALSVLSGCLPNVVGRYKDEEVTPNLYNMIVARSGSGKGILRWARKLGSKLHDKLSAEYRKAIDEEEKSQLRKSLFLPANISSSALYSDLNENDGQGIIYAPEADTLSNAIEQEWGDFSAVLRTAYHHEPLSLRRQSDNRDIEIPNPRLSVLLSGTPNQVKPLIDSVENGLFSRFSFWDAESPTVFKNPFEESETDLDSIFDSVAERVQELYSRLDDLDYTIRVSITDEQVELFMKKYSPITLLRSAVYGKAIESTIFRIALMHYKLCMILSVMRYADKNAIPSEIECKDVDYRTADLIVWEWLKSAERIFKRISDPLNEVKKPSKARYYTALPNSPFKRKEAVEIGSNFGISRAAVDRMLKEWDLIEKVAYGMYKKQSENLRR